jgi:serine/threonine protein kinase
MESGQTIAGKYRLNHLLGSGGMAIVWSATNIFTERDFAIKFMLPHVARTTEAARRFLLEAKVSARIDHPNIIEVIDVGQTEESSLFLVMELLTGVSLDTAMRRQQPAMSVHEFTTVMIQVARALAAAHKSGVIHRDLKPTNVFLHKDREGGAVPKLLDFGVSKFLEDESNHALTMAGTVVGSPLYMSPEQARGLDGIDGRTDIFAFGAIFFEAMCGRRCFEGHNFNALIVAIATTQPQSIDVCAPSMPAGLRAVVSDCLIVDRDKRASSFDDIADRLVAALPEIERSSVRIRAPAPDPLSDPDATNALPVVRSSERAAPVGSFASATEPPRAIAADGFNAWKSLDVGHPKRSRAWLALAAGGLVGVGALSSLLLGGAKVTARGKTQVPVANAQTASTAAPSGSSAAPAVTPVRPASEPPVVNVDSLPVAMKSPSPGSAPPRGMGRLTLGAGPGWCTITIDGTSRGATPISAIDLPAGSHAIRCEPPNGRPKYVSVVIQDGATARYKFSIDD